MCVWLTSSAPAGLGDGDWASFLPRCPSLLWLGLGLQIYGDATGGFEQRAWHAIPASVRVLQVECGGRTATLKSRLEVCTLTPSSTLAPSQPHTLALSAA